MILLCFKFLKILLLAFVVFLNYNFCKKTLANKQIILLSVLIILFAFMANFCSNFLPPLRDTITLTALDEKNDYSMASDIYLNGYTIDGKEFVSGKSLEIVDGHWFWNGESYAWRSVTDDRKPDDITESVIVRIPVGWNRFLEFGCGNWQGIVEVDNGKHILTFDTFTENGSIESLYIGSSNKTILILNQCQYFFLYLLILFGLLTLYFLFIHYYLIDKQKIFKWYKRNEGKFIYGSIASIMFFFLFCYSSQTSFWADELSQVTFTKGSLSEVIQYCLSLREANPPLELLIHNIWYHMVPYGEQWLLLPSITLSVLAIFIVGLIGEKLAGKYCGILAAIIMASSNVFCLNVAFEYRSYAFFMFFATLTLFCYLERNNNLVSIKWNLLFFLSLTCLAMIHYFGMIACALYFVADFYLFLKKKLIWKNGIMYLLPGLTSVAWLLMVVSANKGFESYPNWMPVPNISHILALLKFLTGNFEVSYWLFCLGLAVVLFNKDGKYKKDFWKNYYCNFLVFMLLSTILFVYVYGNYINSISASFVTLWVDRYFLFLMPNVTLISALALCGLPTANILKMQCKKQICGFLFIVLFLNCFSVVSTLGSTETYREAADWIYTQSDNIFDDKTLIIMVQTVYDSLDEGWQEYYITRQGRRDALNVINQYNVQQDDLLKYDKIYLQYSHGNILPWINSFLNENYQLEIDNQYIKVMVYTRK